MKQIRKNQPITETDVERKKLTNLFMAGYFELYLLLRNNPDLKLDSKYKNFIEESQNILGYLTSDLNHYISELEYKTGSTYYGNEWEEIVCLSRSAIEAVKEIYRGTEFEKIYEGDDPEILDLDTEDIDDLIEMRAHKEGYLKEEDIPREIPTSHWWWWSPEEPPSELARNNESKN